MLKVIITSFIFLFCIICCCPNMYLNNYKQKKEFYTINEQNIDIVTLDNAKDYLLKYLEEKYNITGGQTDKNYINSSIEEYFAENNCYLTVEIYMSEPSAEKIYELCQKLKNSFLNINLTIRNDDLFIIYDLSQ